MYGHTLINNFTGAPFTLVPPDNAIKHLVVEGYIGKRTPLTVSFDNQFVTENDVSIDGVEDFIYRNMVDAKPGSDLAKNLLVGEGATFSVPRIFSSMRAGLQKDIDAYYATKADFDRRYNQKIRAAQACRVLNFSCSKTVLYAQAAAIQVEKATYVTTNGLQVTYKEHWVDDIDSGLRAWPRFSDEIAKSLVISSQKVDTQQAQAIAEKYVYDHLLSMAGAPDALGATVSFIDRVLSAILPTFLVEAISDMKKDLLNYLLKNTFGLTIDEIKGYLTNPELYFNSVMNSGGGGEKTTLGKFNAEQLKIFDSGYSNPKEKFNYEKVPAAYNTVTMTKLLLMSPSGINQMLKDLGSSSQLNTPNAMLGFIRTLDGDNQWYKNDNKMILAQDCNTYEKVFMRQTGQIRSDACVLLGSVRNPVTTSPENPSLPYGPDTCEQSYVWREANSSDHVCVPPERRARVLDDNALADERREPNGGDYGPDSCIQGYVWREADPSDHVCVIPEERSIAAEENSHASERRVVHQTISN